MGSVSFSLLSLLSIRFHSHNNERRDSTCNRYHNRWKSHSFRLNTGRKCVLLYGLLYLCYYCCFLSDESLFVFCEAAQEIVLDITGQQQQQQENEGSTIKIWKKQKAKKISTGSLRPSDLPEPEIFTDWDLVPTTWNTTTTTSTTTQKSRNLTIAESSTGNGNGNGNGNGKQPMRGSNRTVLFETNGVQIQYASGTVQQTFAKKSKNGTNPGTETTTSIPTISTTSVDVTFSVLNSVVNRTEVRRILELLRGYEKYEMKHLDDDPDTVDGMPSYEIFVDNPTIRSKHNEYNEQEMPILPAGYNGPSPIKHRDYSDSEARRVLREKLQEILVPIINERITPFVHWKYPDMCGGTSRSASSSNDNNTKTNSNPTKKVISCVACYSLIRRYRYGERVSHAPHHDGHALVTAVTSLSDYDSNYRGGLYVVSPNHYTNQTTIAKRPTPSTVEEYFNKKENALYQSHFTSLDNRTTGTVRFLGLNAGDTAIHTSALLHGVKVYNKIKKPKTTERWSWILWFRDVVVDYEDDNDTHITSTTTASPEINENDKDSARIVKVKPALSSNNTISLSSCDIDRSIEWFKDCAIAGDAICQQLHSTKVTTQEEVVYWNMKAAHNGAGTAAVKIARAYLKQLHSALEFNDTKAMEYYLLSLQANNNPEGHYGIVQWLLVKYKDLEIQLHKQSSINDNDDKILNIKEQLTLIMKRVVYHLEEAAMAGHVYAMFNLGIAHTYGYGIYNTTTTATRKTNSLIKGSTNRNDVVSNNNDVQMTKPIIDIELASQWFIESGLPEGYYTASFYYSSVGNQKLSKQCMDYAMTLGYGTPYRTEARKRTGSGGMSGIDLNLPWPKAHDGRVPPQF